MFTEAIVHCHIQIMYAEFLMNVALFLMATKLQSYYYTRGKHVEAAVRFQIVSFNLLEDRYEGKQECTFVFAPEVYAKRRR